MIFSFYMPMCGLLSLSNCIHQDDWAEAQRLGWELPSKRYITSGITGSIYCTATCHPRARHGIVSGHSCHVNRSVFFHLAGPAGPSRKSSEIATILTDRYGLADKRGLTVLCDLPVPGNTWTIGVGAAAAQD